MLALSLVGCAATKPVTPQKPVPVVYSDYDLYSYVFVENISCEIPANDSSVKENIEACKDILVKKTRAKGADAVLIISEESCLKDPAIDCDKSNAVRIKASIHSVD